MTPASSKCRPPQRLNVALEANAAAYRRAVQTSAPGDCWDFLVLTAANEKQATGYRQELALRHRAIGPTSAFFPAIQKSLVVADPPGKRAGSGGATLGVMRRLSKEYGLTPADFDRLRILLIHSGGASQRLPAYSPLGKIFAPLPLLRPDGQISTLFDHLYVTLAGLPERLGAGMLVLAGDVFLLFDHRHVSQPRAGVTALSMRVDAETGRGHGVFVTDTKQSIQQTLQKVSVDQMRESGATDSAGRVLIDTGLLFFDAPRTRLLSDLATSSRKRPALDQKFTPIDLYEDMTAALAAGTHRASFLKETKLPELRRQLWKSLHGIGFHVMQLEGEFLHLGTTLQFRDAMVGNHPSPAAELFQQNVLTRSAWPLGPGTRVYHSALLAGKGTIGKGTVVEHSILRHGSSIGANSVVSQVLAIEHPIIIPQNTLLFQVPCRGSEGDLGFVHVICGVEDDFKGNFGEGKCRYLNAPIDEWLTRHNIAPKEIWAGIPDEKRTLWTARLFASSPKRDAANQAEWMCQSKRASASQLGRWRRAERYSMAMMLEQADPNALIEHREVVSAYLHAAELLKSIESGEDRSAHAFISHYTTPGAYDAAVAFLEHFATPKSGSSAHALQQSRALWSIAQLLQRPDHPAGGRAHQRLDHFMRASFAKVAEASGAATSISIGQSTHDAKSIIPNISIIATAPVRLDLAGGWSDTPPYCFERGGHVVNVAIDLGGQPPVRAQVRTTREPTLILESHDLGKTTRLDRLNANAEPDMADPFALHKVALQMTGLAPSRSDTLQTHLKRLGAGLVISTECRVPKGSGLGTSSILAATLLSALHRLVGGKLSDAALTEQTLLLEQRLSTGGGWQDQVGGIVGGVKSTITAPGIPQHPKIERLKLSTAQLDALEQRLVVYYSGQQRLARDILRRVIGRWIGREPSVLLLSEELKLGADQLRHALLAGQWSRAASIVARYWQIKKELYPGSTTPSIDVLFMEMREHYQAAGLAGAGGGGFAYFFCKDKNQTTRLKEILSERSATPGSLGSVFDARINREGLVCRKSKSQ